MAKITKKQAQEVARLLKREEDKEVGLVLSRDLKRVKVVIRDQENKSYNERYDNGWKVSYLKDGNHYLYNTGRLFTELNRQNGGKHTIKDLAPSIYVEANRFIEQYKTILGNDQLDKEEMYSGIVYFEERTTDFYLVSEKTNDTAWLTPLNTHKSRDYRGNVTIEPDLDDVEDVEIVEPVINGVIYLFRGQ